MRIKINRWILCALTLCCMPRQAPAARMPLTTNGVDWGVNYYNPNVLDGEGYDKLPTDAANTFPVWVAGYNTGSYALSNSFLRIVTASNRGGGAETRQTFSTKSGWDLTANAVVEATLRVVEHVDGLPAAGAQQICYGNGEIRSFIAFTSDSVRTSAGKSFQHNMKEWTTVRLVFENMEDSSGALVKIYLNGGSEPVLINDKWYPSSAALNCLRFGDMNASSGGTVDWESIRWKCAGAAVKASVPAAEKPYSPRSQRAREGWGVIFNEDGDFCITDPDPEVSVQYIRNMLGELADTPVKTVMHSVGAGSDILYYPSLFGSYWGWRALPKYEDHAAWGPRIRAGRSLGEAGADLIMAAADKVNEMGMYFVPSVRMNDAHFVFDPLNYPLTGRFWMENQDKTIVHSPIAGRDYGSALNFLHKEVRDYRLGIITEVIERYGEKMEGLELDFNRFQLFFPAGRAEEGLPLMTELVREVRAKLNAKSSQTGRSYTLFVRVPPALRNCRWSGLDIETWAKEGLVDVVIPSQMMTIAHDKPVQEFTDLLAPLGVGVFPTLYERTQFNAPMSASVPETISASDFTRIATPAQVAGVILNQLAQGAKGFQLYNFDIPLRPDDVRILDYMNDKDLIGERAYLVTAGYYLDHEDNYQYRKQLPLPVMQGNDHSVTLLIGEDLSDPDLSRILRLGFSKPLTKETELCLSINGEPIYDGTVENVLVPVRGVSRGAASYLYFSFNDRNPFLKGKNQITFSVKRIADPGDLTEVQLHITPPGSGDRPQRDHLFRGGEQTPLQSSVRDFGLIWNTDGDISFTDLDPDRSMAHLKNAVASLSNSAVRTLALSIGSGSDILNYPTSVAQTWGWRQTPYDDHPRWKNRIQGGRAAMERGVDAVRTAGEQAKQSGLLFVPSYRVADSHYCAGPETYPLTSRFWLENNPACIIGQSPTANYEPYRNQLDFAQDSVRAYRLDIIREAVDRYADLMDGFQMDFMRTPVFFRPGEEWQHAPKLTDLLRQVRRHLDETGKKRGIHLPLLVRIPASIDLCRNVGIDIETWVREGLADVIMPAQMMSVAQEMPLTEFVRLTEGTDCRVHASLCSRSAGWTWFYRDTLEQTPRRNPLRLAEPALFSAAAANYRAMGVDRFELYNFALPLRDDGIKITRLLTDPLPADDLLYSVTRDEVWYEDFCQFPKDLPETLVSGQPVFCRLLTGKVPGDLNPPPAHVGMRLGFEGIRPDTRLRIRLNGQTLFEGSPGAALRISEKPAASFFHVPVPDQALIRRGDNRVETTLLDQGTETVLLSEILLAVLF